MEIYGKGIADVDGTLYDWTPTTRLQPVKLGNAGGVGSGSELLVTDPSTVETRVLARGSTAAGARYAGVWRAATEISRPAGSAARPWTRQTSDRFVAADLDGDGAQEIVAVSTSARAGVLRWSAASARLELGWATDGVVPPPGAAAGAGSLTPPLGSVDAGAAWRLQASDRYVAADVDGDGSTRSSPCRPTRAWASSAGSPARPRLPLRTRQAAPEGRRPAHRENAPDPSSPSVSRRRSRRTRPTRTLPEPRLPRRGVLFRAGETGLRLARDGAYTAALDWFASVYDITRPPASRKVARKLELEELLTSELMRRPDWLRDPLNPHAIAALRPSAYTRYTIIAIVRTLLAYADAEFTRETSESVARALELYLTALELLGAPELAERLPGCSDIIGRVEIEVGEPEFRSLWQEVHELLADVPSADALTAAVRKIERLQASDREPGAMVAEARAIALEAGRVSATLSTAVVDKTAALEAAVAAALADDHVAAALRTSLDGDAAPPAYADSGSDGDRIPIHAAGSGSIDDLLDRSDDEWIDGYFTQPSFSFCATPNPDVAALRTHAEANLAKIRTCRNIAGAATRMEPYAPSGAAETISDGRLPSPARRTAQPLSYRYSTLIERAKQLAQVAMQAEASLLGTLERRDAAAYDELRARQDLELAEAGVRQKDLQLAQASEGVTVAQAGRDRAELAHDRLVGLHREADFRGNLQTSLGIMQVIYQLAKTVAAAEAGGGGGGGAAGGESAGGLFTSGGSDLFGAITGLIKTVSTWQDEVHKLEFDIKVAALDQRAAEAGLRAAQTGVQIAAQDRGTSALRLDHAAAVAEFMARKFTGLALYEWMSGVLQDVYRYFLQQAAATARLAEAQLAFERQEIPPAFIQGDYWARPASLAATGGTKGLTGSDRLQRDIFELDQYAFRTDQRKLLLTKTISLAQLGPLAFRRFQETGVMHFSDAGAAVRPRLPWPLPALGQARSPGRHRADPAGRGDPRDAGDHRHLARRPRVGLRDGRGRARPGVGRVDVADPDELRVRPRQPACDARPLRAHRRRRRLGAVDAEGRQPVRLRLDRRRAADRRLHGARQPGAPRPVAVRARPARDVSAPVQLPKRARRPVVGAARPGGGDAEPRALPGRAARTSRRTSTTSASTTSRSTSRRPPTLRPLLGRPRCEPASRSRPTGARCSARLPTHRPPPGSSRRCPAPGTRHCGIRWYPPRRAPRSGSGS